MSIFLAEQCSTTKITDENKTNTLINSVPLMNGSSIPVVSNEMQFTPTKSRHFAVRLWERSSQLKVSSKMHFVDSFMVKSTCKD